MKKRFFGTIGILLSMVMMSSSCSLQKSKIYVPEKEWLGAETRKYDDRGEEVWAYVSEHPLGTPDPEPILSNQTDSTDLSRISCRTEKEQYSLSRDREIVIEVTYHSSENQTTETGELDAVSLHHQTNLERWNGEEWERMIYVTPDMYTMAAILDAVIYPGETARETLSPDCVITALTPGKYRAIAYINYQPVYAEFELVE